MKPTAEPPRRAESPRWAKRLIVLTALLVVVLAAVLLWILGPALQTGAVLARHAAGKTRLVDARNELGGEEPAVARIRFYCHLPSTSPEQRRSGAAILSRCGAAALPVLIELLDDPDKGVRAQAAASLSQEVSEVAGDAVAALTRVLKTDADFTVRQYAARALGAIGVAEEQTVLALRQALTDEEVLVRRNAADALGRMGSGAKAGAADLRKSLGDADPWTRRFSALALWLITGESEPSVSVLRDLANGADEDIASVAKRDLARIEGGSRPSPE